MSRVYKLGRYYYDLDNVWRCSIVDDPDGGTVLTINEEIIRIYKKDLATKAKQLVKEFVKGCAK